MGVRKVVDAGIDQTVKNRIGSSVGVKSDTELEALKNHNDKTVRNQVNKEINNRLSSGTGELRRKAKIGTNESSPTTLSELRIMERSGLNIPT